MYDFTSTKLGALIYLFVTDKECVYLYDFTSGKSGPVMYQCFKDIECVYLYDFTSTKPGAFMYLCVKDIERAYVYDFTSTNCMTLPLLSQEQSCIYGLRMSNVSICMIYTRTK